MSVYGMENVVFGPVEGYYPVSPTTDKVSRELWVPNGIQAYETRVLVQEVKESGYRPDLIMFIVRGGSDAGREFAYGMGVKNCMAIQTDGFSNENTAKDETIIINHPDIEILKALQSTITDRPFRVLVADELVDNANAIYVVLNWLTTKLPGAEIKTACPINKLKPHPIEVDFKVRDTTNEWLDHYSQSTDEHRMDRMKELAQYAGIIANADGFLPQLPANRNMHDEIMGRTKEFWKVRGF